MPSNRYVQYRMMNRKRYLLQTAERAKEALASARFAKSDAITSIDEMNLQLIINRLEEAIQIAEEEAKA